MLRAKLDFTGERYVPGLKGQIYYEHLHRYVVASQFCVGKRVLDVACGEGYGAAFLSRRAGSVVGIDLDPVSIAHARDAYRAPNLTFITGSATDIPLDEMSIDVITSFETIEHLTDHDRMLDEFRRVLLPSGVLCISSPNKLVYSDQPNYHNPYHVRELYYQEFRDQLERRFKSVVIYGQRLYTSSVLHPLPGAPRETTQWYAGDLNAIDTVLPPLDDPVYFVAVCSNEPLNAQISSSFLDPHDDLLKHIRTEFEAEVASVRERAALEAGGGSQQPIVAGSEVETSPSALEAQDDQPNGDRML
jgi:ubiquinone/menaquinone biosynthesis C-methylase UbiE